MFSRLLMVKDDLLAVVMTVGIIMVEYLCGSVEYRRRPGLEGSRDG